MRIENHHVSVKPGAIARILGAIAFTLVIFSIGVQFSKFVLGHGGLKGLVPLLYLDGERNIPTYFSILLMLAAASLLAIITIVNRKQGLPYIWKWAILSLGFFFMAFDEAFQVHERLTLPVRSLLGETNLGLFYFAWIVPAIGLVLCLAMFFRRFLLHLPVRARLRFLTAGALYLGGAIGIESIGGRYAESLVAADWTYSLFVAAEEGLEMAGLVVFLWALLEYCAESYGKIQLRFES